MNKSLREFVRLPESYRVPWLGDKLYDRNCRSDLKRIQNAYVDESCFNHESHKEKVIVSMTSFPARINEVQYAVKSLMLQTWKPDRIILWLAESQFPDRRLPDSLRKLERIGLEIRYCDDLLGHKRYYKVYPGLKENEVLITYDDDILFSNHSIERIMKTHERFPECIVCDRGQTMTRDAEGNIMIPGRWKTITAEGIDKPSYKVLPSPGGGCLYFKGALYKDACDEEAIRRSLRVDDLFLMFMALENDTPVIKTEKYHRTFTIANRHQEVQLGRDAIIKGFHMEALDKYETEYPHAYSHLIESAKR